MHIDYARRRARGGTGVIPPNKTQWEHEHNALDVRDALGLAPDQALPAIPMVYSRLLPGVEILPHGSLPAAAVHLNHFRTAGKGSWSGFALPLDEATTLVVYNDAHPATRVRATLMEEFFHIYLEQPPSIIRVLPDSEDTGRTHDAGVERAAYSTAAACLVPYLGLKRFATAGTGTRQIAGHFHVSPALVAFRLKVTKLYGKSRRA